LLPWVKTPHASVVLSTSAPVPASGPLRPVRSNASRQKALSWGSEIVAGASTLWKPS